MVDVDEYRQPCISWNVTKPYRPRRLLVGRTLLLFAVPTFFLHLVHTYGHEHFWLWLSCWFFVSTVWFGIGSMSVWHELFGSRPPPARLTLKQAWLRYHPGGNQPSDEVGRWGITDVRVDHVDGRQRLVIETSTTCLEVGSALCESDREWLADVLRTWVRSSQSPAEPSSDVYFVDDKPEGFA